MPPSGRLGGVILAAVRKWVLWAVTVILGGKTLTAADKSSARHAIIAAINKFATWAQWVITVVLLAAAFLFVVSIWSIGDVPSIGRTAGWGGVAFAYIFALVGQFPIMRRLLVLGAFSIAVAVLGAILVGVYVLLNIRVVGGAAVGLGLELYAWLIAVWALVFAATGHSIYNPKDTPGTLRGLILFLWETAKYFWGALLLSVTIATTIGPGRWPLKKTAAIASRTLFAAASLSFNLYTVIVLGMVIARAIVPTPPSHHVAAHAVAPVSSATQATK